MVRECSTSPTPAGARRPRESRARDGLGRRALELAVLCAFAFAQPLFDLLGRNPEFFAVRGSPSGDIVLFAVGLVLLPPLVLTGVEALAGLAGPRARDAVHAVLVALLGALIAIQVVKRIGALPAGLDLALAVAAGLALAWALVVRRARVARTFVTVLSPAPLLFLALFLLGSRVTQLVLPEDAEVATASARPGAPVVMVVFDEFPLTSLLGRDGRIDRVRYPSFATLAARSTWYSHATTVFDSTTHAVPAILDGRRPRKGSLPTLAHHPHNLFTLLGRSYRLNVSEEATHLCPRSLCPNAVQPGLGRRLRSLASTPGWSTPTSSCRRRSRTACPRSRRAGATSTAATRGDAVLKLLGGGGRPARFDAWVRSIRPSSPPALNFKHVLLPHVPWQYLPDGHGYGRGGGRPPGLTGPQAANDPFLVRQRYQRHLLQAGFTDRLLGRLIARLRETGLWDRALVVVTADHGVSFRVGQADRRAVTPENVEDIAPVPLFVKAPGQRTGRVSTRPVETIDILPTIADELGVHLPWRVDGRSAEGPAPAGRPAVDMLTRALGATAPRRRRSRAPHARRGGAQGALLRLGQRRSRPLCRRTAPGAARPARERAGRHRRRRRLGGDRRGFRAGRRRSAWGTARAAHRADLRRRSRPPRPGARGQRARGHRLAVLPVGGPGALLGVRPAADVPVRAQSRRGLPRPALWAAPAARGQLRASIHGPLAAESPPAAPTPARTLPSDARPYAPRSPARLTRRSSRGVEGVTRAV